MVNGTRIAGPDG